MELRGLVSFLRNRSGLRQCRAAFTSEVGYCAASQEDLPAVSDGYVDRNRVLAAVLAVVGPVLVLAAAWLLLDRYADPEERQAIANAGRVLNARVAENGDIVEIMERMLRQAEPEVLLIGPSYANTDVDPDLLAQRLGLPRDDVLMLSVPNSVGAHWYAILKHRVFANGHRPRLVVVISGMQSMLLGTPLTEASYVNLAVQLDGPDPVVEDKARTTTRLLLARMREKRGHLRDALFAFVRDVPAGLLLRSPIAPGGLQPHEVRRALDRVFDDDNVDMTLHHSGTPIVELDRAERVYDPSLLPEVDRSFIPDITAMVDDHGGHMVWVRPPMSPDIPAELDDVVPSATEAAVPEVVHALGGTFLDMRRLPMSSAMFKNDDHMNEEGSRRFTEALARALREMEAVARADALQGLPPVEAVIEILEQPNEVPVAEASWPGQGTWIGPGATLRVRLPKGWEAARGPLAVTLAAEQRVAGPAPSLVAAGQPVRLVGSDGADWRAWRGGAVVRRPEGAIAIDVQVPEGGVWTRVTGLAVGEGPARHLVIGDEGALDGLRARLFGVFTFEGGVMTDQTVHPRYHRPPSKVPGADRPVLDGPGAIGRYDTERWEFLSDERLIGETNFGSRCSPLRITEDGAELPLANVPCVEVQRKGGGRSCHTPEDIWFTTVDGSDPATNGRTYRLVLDAGRRCDGAVWLYPKDSFEVAWPEDRLAVFRRGADALLFGARYLQKRPTVVEIVLRVDGVERLREEINGLDLKADPLRFPLDPPIPPGTTDVVLEVRNTDATFYLVTEAALSEGGAP